MSKYDRKKADDLGKGLDKGRKDTFGKKLNDKDRRFFGLREDGFTGPIDQDGYPGDENLFKGWSK